MRRRILSVVVLCAVIGSGCAASARHTAVLADTALYEALNNIHVTEQIALCGQASCAGVALRVTPTWTDEKSQDFNRRLLPGIAAGREFNAVLASWVPGQPMPTMLRNLVVSLSSSLSAVVASFPEGSTKSTILADIAKGQSIVLSALDLLLSIGGS